ncbi:MAG: ABC transporter permease [Dehalococcoidia bacterium]
MAVMARARGHARRLPWATAVLATAVTALVLLPPVYLVGRAVSAGSGIEEALTDSSAVQALGRTLLLTASVTGTCVALAVPLAWITARTDVPLARVWTVLLMLPLAIPSFVGGFVMISAFGPGGMAQDLLEPLGVERLPSIYGFSGAWLVLSLLSYPYIYLQASAALGRMDGTIEEASRSLGKGGWTTFVHVHLPQLRPAVAAGALLTALYVLSEFGAVSMLRYDTLTPLIYIEYTTGFDRTTAAVLGLPLIALAALLVTVDGVTRGAARYHTRSGAGRQRRVPLGRWRWPAFALCAVVALLGAGVPVGVILYWLVRGLQSGADSGFVVEALLNSARAAGLAAVVAALGALPIALLSVRHRGWFSGLLEKLSYTGQALPAITIALALVFFMANYATRFYQTLGVLVVAYAVRFLPEALGATRAALLQVNPNGEEAARSLGAGPVRTFLRVTAPQMAPGVSAGMLLVFLSAVKELPITLLLSPIGFETLATDIWSSTSEAFFTRAALPSLILLTLSGLAVLLLLRRERLS